MLGERQSVTAEDLEKMVYLEQVVLVCLCLHPVQLYTIILNAHTRTLVKRKCESGWRSLEAAELQPTYRFGTIYSVVSWTTSQPTSGVS